MRRGPKRGVIMIMLVGILILTGCQAASDVPEITKAAAEAMETSKEDDSEAKPLQEENDIPEDGIITAGQMATIEGKEGTYYFNGESPEGIRYRWAYEGNKIKNSEEQALKVEFFTEGVDKVQEAANDAPYGIGFELKKMNMASPATLTITLTEQWDADKVLVCIQQDGNIYQFSEAEIMSVKSDEEENDGNEVSQISFQVTKAGDTFYLLGGSSEADDAAENSQNNDSQNNTTQDEDTQADTDVDAGGDRVEGNTDTNGGTDSNDNTSLALTCTISIECSTILDRWDDFNQTKAEFVPSDGWILASTEVEFSEGETVFDVLKRVCNEAGIHMASRYTPMYGSYYIEGINQLYEYDCGANSGWMYRVKGWYPNYGCSSYTLEDGDNIEWRYTCDLGSDIGGGY